MTFTTADGWRFIVFNDGGQWDYVECVYAPDGRALGSDDISDVTTPRLDAYCPRTVEIARRWGLDDGGAKILAEYSG